jgi:hypothetical protein
MPISGRKPGEACLRPCVATCSLAPSFSHPGPQAPPPCACHRGLSAAAYHALHLAISSKASRITAYVAGPVAFPTGEVSQPDCRAACSPCLSAVAAATMAGGAGQQPRHVLACLLPSAQSQHLPHCAHNTSSSPLPRAPVQSTVYVLHNLLADPLLITGSPQPSPEPKPEPEPSPEPQPESAPAPVPEPAAVPEPAPVPVLEPASAPVPEPAVAPQPEPEPQPEDVPLPEQLGAPEAAPESAPAPY